jgi:hypothetical protein
MSADELVAELEASPVAGVRLLVRDLEDLADLDRLRQVREADVEHNRRTRLQGLAAVARLAELGRQQMYRAERKRASQHLDRVLRDEQLARRIAPLVAAGEQLKPIRSALEEVTGGAVSTERATRIRKLARAQLSRDGKRLP